MKNVNEILRVTGWPTCWLARQLKKLIPHNEKHSQVFVGLGLFLLGMFVQTLLHHWTVEIGAEVIKAVGVAPICRVVCDALKWEA